VYEIRIRRQEQKALSNVPMPYREKLEDAIESLAATPRPHGVAKLSVSNDLYRIRISHYRVVYTIDDLNLVVSIEKVAHRREIYKEL